DRSGTGAVDAIAVVSHVLPARRAHLLRADWNAVRVPLLSPGRGARARRLAAPCQPRAGAVARSTGATRAALPVQYAQRNLDARARRKSQSRRGDHRTAARA